MPFSADICVIGAGPVGLAFALALQKRSAGRRAVILDRGQARPDDGKSVAFGPRSRAFLRELDAWPSREKPIRRAKISFSVFPDLTREGARGGFRPLELRADGESALAYVASHQEVRAALFSQLREDARTGMVLGIRDAGDFAEVRFQESGGEIELLRAKLVVLACEFARMPAGFTIRDFDYGQCALALSGQAENTESEGRERDGREGWDGWEGGWEGETAYEHFSPDGLVTLVPRTGSADLGAVICASSAAGAKWGVLSDSALSSRIGGMFAGGGFGVRMFGARMAYAPHLRRVRPLGLGRIVCIGQGATTVHPIGAQGLNLALRDADSLAAMLSGSQLDEESGRAEGVGGVGGVGGRGGWEGVGAEHARRRGGDHFRTCAATHSLALLARRRGFPLRIAGGIFAALMSADAAAPLRARMTRAAAERY